MSAEVFTQALQQHRAGQFAAAAIEPLAQAVGLNPSAAPYHFNLGRAARALGKTSEAIVCLLRAAELRPGDLETLIQVGATLREAECGGEAAPYYERALALRPWVSRSGWRSREFPIGAGTWIATTRLGIPRCDSSGNPNQAIGPHLSRSFARHSRLTR